MIYRGYQAHADLLGPARWFAISTLPFLGHAPTRVATGLPGRALSAAFEVFGLLRLTHQRPEFGIESVSIDGRDVAVTEECTHRTPFGTLLHFRKEGTGAQPPVLLIAPMSGHFATLLRDTVRTLLVEHDVWITDWHNARDVPRAAGRFGLEEYIDHLIDWLRVIGEGTHVIAICQPCVPALAAAALLAEDADPAVPASLTLMAGPIDCRVSPTEVNRLATSRPIDWFADNLIDHVPLRYAGAMRAVYPGFLQIAAFMHMNFERHCDSIRDLFEDLVTGEHESAHARRSFYEEYFAVADLPAEFYLDTVRLVFQEYALPLGRLQWRGRTVDPSALRRTALLTVEGERDDICGLGQTLAAHDLCTGLRPALRHHYVQTGAGHYGVFSGRRWTHGIYPVIRDVILGAG